MPAKGYEPHACERIRASCLHAVFVIHINMNALRHSDRTKIRGCQDPGGSTSSTSRLRLSEDAN
eukprot:4610061-Pleurochrysis_carterae.AAC.1